ncbi:MAG: hypothetical protein ACYCUI_07095 [Vulcanimicrobiaceae bacterium]
MRRLTIGQVLLLFDALTHYVIFTNPFGSGESTSEPSPAAGGTRTAVFDATTSGILHPQKSVHIDQIDPAIRAALLDESFQERQSP